MFLDFKLRVFFLATESILLNSLILSFLNAFIVKFKPFPSIFLLILVLNERIVMATFRSPWMDDNASQFVIIVGVRLAFLAQVKLAGVFFYVQLLREF